MDFCLCLYCGDFYNDVCKEEGPLSETTRSQLILLNI